MEKHAPQQTSESHRSLRVLFLGTPFFAASCLAHLLDVGFDVIGVVTAPDRPAGRGMQPQASAVKVLAQQHGLPILQPEKLRDGDFLDQIRSWNADVGVAVAFRMLPEVVWSMPRLGTINLHASLLPQLRGAAPIQRAIMAGLTETGVTTFSLNSAIDCGDVLGQKRVAIGPEENAGSLHDRLLEAGKELLVQTLHAMHTGEAVGVPQPSSRPDGPALLEAPKLQKSDSELDWKQTVTWVHNRVRAFSPAPGAWFSQPDGTWKIFSGRPLPDDHMQAPEAPISPGTLRYENGTLRVRCANGWYRLDQIQPAGKKRMSPTQWVNGLRGLIPNSL
jgi:methionyl-tRNA formyltransferase